MVREGRRREIRGTLEEPPGYAPLPPTAVTRNTKRRSDKSLQPATDDCPHAPPRLHHAFTTPPAGNDSPTLPPRSYTPLHAIPDAEDCRSLHAPHALRPERPSLPQHRHAPLVVKPRYKPKKCGASHLGHRTCGFLRGNYHIGQTFK